MPNRADQVDDLLTLRVRLRFDPATHGRIIDRIEGLSATRAAAVISNMLLEWQLLKDLTLRPGGYPGVVDPLAAEPAYVASTMPVLAGEAGPAAGSRTAVGVDKLASEYGAMQVDDF